MPVLNTFPTSPLPDLPIQQAPAYNVAEVAFGDGYALSKPNGINHRTDKVSLSWTNINVDEKNTIMAFLEAHAPSTPFLYTDPGGTQKAYTCKEWSLDHTNGVHYTMRATFTQSHGT